jgi:hypothetical protein
MESQKSQVVTPVPHRVDKLQPGLDVVLRWKPDQKHWIPAGLK